VNKPQNWDRGDGGWGGVCGGGGGVSCGHIIGIGGGWEGPGWVVGGGWGKKQINTKILGGGGGVGGG